MKIGTQEIVSWTDDKGGEKMSNLIREIKKCSCCEKESEQIIVASTNTFGGSPDLDLRPPEMKRGTMPYWVQMCPHCQYVAVDIEKAQSFDKGILEQEEYKKCGNMKLPDELSKMFYRYYLIALSRGDVSSAFNGIRNAAWACDDMSSEECARTCRELGIGLLNNLIEVEENPKIKESMLSVKADMLRRIERFDELMFEYSNLAINEEIIQKIISFEIERARVKDSSTYTIKDAIK